MTAPAAPSPVPPLPRTVITAAASRYTVRKTTKGSQSKSTDTGWQERAWSFYDSTPEVRFAAQWISAAMSSATLYAGYRGDDGRTIETAPPDSRAAQIVADIAGGPEGQAQLLGRMGPQLVVPGEGWIVVVPGEDDALPAWHVVSVREMSRQGQKMIAEIEGEPVEVPPADPDGTANDRDPIGIRVWQAHPGRYMDADSPVRASLGLLDELQLLNAAVGAAARSRLLGRGVLLVPKGTKFPGTPVQGDAEDDLIEIFMNVAETAYREPESAAAAVPIILEVPAEQIAAIKRITFESDYDELAIRLREEAIRRFANGLDTPAEILLGLGDTNHWGAWALKEEAVTLGVQPRLDVVTHALTTQWLRPLLDAERVEDAHRYIVATDTSNLRVRGNRSQTALEVYQAGGIGGVALRRETGFTEDDAPTAEELAARHAPADEPGDDTEDRNGEENAPMDDTTTPRPLPVDETQSEPNTLPASAARPVPAGVVEAADVLIWHALATAGRKLLKTPACPRSGRAWAQSYEPAALHTVIPIKAAQIDQWSLFEGAWPRLAAVANRHGLDPECLTASLEAYCRDLITSSVPHAYEQTAAALDTECLGIAA
ncbi:hypothetical protein [Streptomyces sp. CA-253872]|uniref:hypothetical protein n=1 Tax=Streptomyces sp. CA-253872 TaxID=3240067 RepID=UPI003D8DE6D9